MNLHRHADTSRQDCSVCPRHWYIDARFRCVECGADFLWSAQEQQIWFETYRFSEDLDFTISDGGHLNRSYNEMPISKNSRVRDNDMEFALAVFRIADEKSKLKTSRGTVENAVRKVVREQDNSTGK